MQIGGDGPCPGGAFGHPLLVRPPDRQRGRVRDADDLRVLQRRKRAAGQGGIQSRQRIAHGRAAELPPAPKCGGKGGDPHNDGGDLDPKDRPQILQPEGKCGKAQQEQGPQRPERPGNPLCPQTQTGQAQGPDQRLQGLGRGLVGHSVLRGV
ncbi:hypothetical protein MASR1M32_06300 [Rhodobacter sp.]